MCSHWGCSTREQSAVAQTVTRPLLLLLLVLALLKYIFGLTFLLVHDANKDSCLFYSFPCTSSKSFVPRHPSISFFHAHIRVINRRYQTSAHIFEKSLRMQSGSHPNMRVTRSASKFTSQMNKELVDAIDKMEQEEQDTAANTCPVCFEAFTYNGHVYRNGVEVPDNAIGCSNKHMVCIKCVGKICSPHRCMNPRPSCPVFTFTCPVCRDLNSIYNMQLLCILKNSWSAAMNCFGCEHEMRDWLHQHRK